MIWISACAIVRDEERNIERWLESVKNLADEIVVVDTGSRDRTVAMAEAGGAEIRHFPWRDDFAAAKNYALDCCRGDWVVMLDADEYFLPEDAPKVRRLLAEYREKRNVLGFLFQRINIDQDNYGAYIDSGPQIRVFRRLPDLRYHGRIHENLRYEGGEGREMVFSSEAVIYHTGYSSGLLREKYLRNLALLKRDEEEGRGEGKEFYFADCYYGLRDYQNAGAYARQGIEKGLSVAVGDDCRPFQIWIESLMLTGASEEEILAAVERAKAIHPEAGRFDFLAGFHAWDRGDFLGALEHFQRGIRTVEATAGKTSPLAGAGKEKYLADACCRLAQAALWRGRTKEALEWAGRALREERYNVRALGMWLKLLEGAEPVEVISLLNGIYDKKGDAPFLAKHLSGASWRSVRLYYMTQAGWEPGEAEGYWLAGRTAAAAASLAEEMDALLRLGLLRATEEGTMPGHLGTLLPAIYRRAAAGRAETPKEANLCRRMKRLGETMEGRERGERASSGKGEA